MPRALLSVSDKTGLVEFASSLVKLGWTLLATGGTATLLREHGVPLEEVAEYTGSPEILGGRVKTLHPAIHGGLLARDRDADRAELARQGWELVDLVAVNLYPFEKTVAREHTLEDAIENIDIGGVALIRASSKNFERVTLVCDPGDYPAVLKEIQGGGVSLERRRELALKGFSTTARYDSAIAGYLGGGRQLSLFPVQDLRYGENPHQTARLYSTVAGAGPLGGRVLQGKELSYNNLLDLDAAWRGASSFEEPSCCIVKHLSPCGVACASNPAEAFRLALASDPVSAFGGVIAFNRPVTEEVREALGDLFVECIAAPGFEADFSAKKNLRLLEILDREPEPYELRTVHRGVLWQDRDHGDPSEDFRVVSRREPTAEEWEALRFAWIACQHVKSNAIVLARGRATVGIGGGQPNRVDCVRIAAERAGEKARGSVMASDAFFPFPDSVRLAASHGVTAVIHPGGSKRDEESIAAADELKMAMVVTGVRHFRH